MHISNDIFFENVKAELAEGRDVRIRVVGTSMKPTFKTEVDSVVITSKGVSDLSPRDIVLFNLKGQVKLHRIIKIQGDELYIRGDGIYFGPFERCSKADVIGVVSGSTLFGAKFRFKGKGFFFRTYSFLYVA